jgi:hypothetical protein
MVQAKLLYGFETSVLSRHLLNCLEKPFSCLITLTQEMAVHCLTSDDNTMCGSSLINSSQKYIAKAANLGPTDEVEYDGVTYKICMAELMT